MICDIPSFGFRVMDYFRVGYSVAPFLEIISLQILLKLLLASQNWKNIRKKSILIQTPKNWKSNILMNKVFLLKNFRFAKFYNGSKWYCSYGPYHILHMIWTIWYWPYNMAHIHGQRHSLSRKVPTRTCM